MEKTNLNFSTVKTNLDEKNNRLVKNNFVDTNNYTRQNLYQQKDNQNETQYYNSKDEFLTNQRSRPTNSNGSDLSEYTRRKLVPITTGSEKYKTTRINIDSFYRNKYPKNILDSTQHFLNENPFYFQSGSNLLTIYDPSHGYSYGDNIIIKNVTVLLQNVKISFEKDNYYVRIELENHNLNPLYNYIVLIQNFIGNNTNNTIFDNININYINKIQNIYFTNGTNIATNNFFYIKINIKPTINNNSVCDINLYSLNGIPLSNINSDYPISINNAQSSLNIINIISQDYYQVKLSLKATIGLINNVNLTSLQNAIGVGGSNIIISKIVNVIEGFPDANHFKYSLGRNFNNVRKIRLLSTEIPNTEKMIRSSPISKQNNLLYWQNVDDGSIEYTIKITEGNYSVDDLATEIQAQIVATPRQGQINVNTSKIVYLNDHFATVNINQNSNKFEISYYTTVILTQAITKSTYSFSDGFIRIIVNHPNHKLNSGDTIFINNVGDTEAIPSTAMNGTFSIETIINVDNYQIKLSKFNVSTYTASTGGGDAINILTPLQSRLLFDRVGTIGNLLGFRNVGDYNAITIYSKTISNIIEYELDSNLNSLGIQNSSIINNTLLNFNGDNYIYLTLNYIFKDSIDIQGIKNIFAKLLLSGNPNTVIYNDFIQIGEEFLNTIISLSELEIFFYTADGILYDFNNINVSFTIELFEEIK
jgi:hypothetical protein